jgi:hypothetical protein
MPAGPPPAMQQRTKFSQLPWFQLNELCWLIKKDGVRELAEIGLCNFKREADAAPIRAAY